MGVKKETKDKKRKGKDTKTPAKKRARKVYEMPGQKKDTPSELNGLRIFYESTLEQRPDSKMAKTWLLTHGLLPRHTAEKMVNELQKKKKKTTTASSRKKKSTKSKKKPASAKNEK